MFRQDTSGPPKVSVLLPVRDGAATLCLALSSLLRQTFSDFEILLLDDGSSDDSVALAQSFTDSRIRVLCDGVRRGLVYRLNQGVALARGSYIARMDADDLSFADRFQKQVAFLDSHRHVDLLGCRAVTFRDDGGVIGLLPFAPDHELLCAKPWNNIPLPHPSWMGRREWFVENPYRTREVLRAEDQELLLRASDTSCYACLDEVLLGYRQAPLSLRRTLIARRSLFAAQVGLFLKRHQWFNLLRATGVSVGKVVFDVLAAVAGAGKLRLRPLDLPAAAVEAQLRVCLEENNQTLAIRRGTH